MLSSMSVSFSFFVENQYPDEAKREEIASTCNSVIQKPGTVLLLRKYNKVSLLKNVEYR